MTVQTDKESGNEEDLLEEQLEALKLRVTQIRNDVPRLKQCSRLNDILQKIYEVRVGLNKMEQDLLRSHLTHCISSDIRVPEAVTVALSKLSKNRYGGIIVLEHEDSLDEHLQGGVIVDGAISAPVLENIFYPGSALHDGAVIIQDSRIQKANVFLPLAPHSEELDALGLGSRHRAALGLSMVTDALIIVVSEEKGWISMALEGQLYPNLGTFALLEKLGDG